MARVKLRGRGGDGGPRIKREEGPLGESGRTLLAIMKTMDFTLSQGATLKRL